MKLFDLVKLYEDGTELTITDTDYDCEFYIYNDNKKEDESDRFMELIIKLLEVDKIMKNGTIIVNLTKLVEDNLDLFKKYSSENWYEYVLEQITEDEELVEEWVLQINNIYFGGNISLNGYKKINEEVLLKILTRH